MQAGGLEEYKLFLVSHLSAARDGKVEEGGRWRTLHTVSLRMSHHLFQWTDDLKVPVEEESDGERRPPPVDGQLRWSWGANSITVVFSSVSQTVQKDFEGNLFFVLFFTCV